MTAIRADALIAGAGLGGIAATLAACDAGMTVVLTEECSRIGGQVTTQAVSALDEHPLVERAGRTATYARFRDGVRAWYARRYGHDVASEVVQNPGGGWVSRLCCEPEVAEHVLLGMLAPHVHSGRLRVITGCRPVGADGEDQVVRAVTFDLEGGSALTIEAAVVADATELGDLLPLVGASWALGAESASETGEPHALAGPGDPRRMQACTMCIVVERRPGEDHTIERPGDYDRWRERFTLSPRRADGTRPAHGFYTHGDTGLPPFWTYRRIRDGRALDPEGPLTDLAVINWPGNDYVDRPLIARSGRDPSAFAEARALSRAFLHWLQTEAPHDDGGGRGHPELRPAPEVSGTIDGIAEFPYVREARRLRPVRRVTEHDLVDDTASARAPGMADGVGLGWYHLDMHARVGDPTTWYEPTKPFQIPAGSLVGDEVANLVAAGKAVGATHVANSALRVHVCEWAIGEAAGVVLAEAWAGGRSPRDVASTPAAVGAVQHRLLARGAPVFWFDDLPDDHASWEPAQLLAIAGAVDADPVRRASLSARPTSPVSARQSQALVAAAARLGRGTPAAATIRGMEWGEACRLLVSRGGATGTDGGR